jgi:hypothetical protein
MAELVDALVSGTSAARRGGSSPLLGTNSFFFPDCCGGDDFEAADLPLQASARGPAGDKIVIVVAVEDNPVTQVA